jgi:hypothetical protein
MSMSTPIGSQCDFCDSPAPEVAYPVPLIHGMDQHGQEQIRFEQGTWAACGLCRPYVEARDVDGLARRVIDRLTMDKPVEVRQALAANLRAAYQAVLDQRGEAVPLAAWVEWVT